MNRASIYVHVSRELQAEKLSPAEQEADVQRYEEDQGYDVFDVYKHVES